MVAAVRIDGEVLYGKRHADLVTDYQNRESVSDDLADAMIEAGRIEFGNVYLAKGGKLEFAPDETRNDVYTSIARMIEIGGPGAQR